MYYDLVRSALSQAARHHLEQLMTTGTRNYQSDFARKYYGQGIAEGEAQGEAKGKAEGRADALLAVLAARGIDVADEARARITGCTDLDRLDTWIHRAVTATGIDDVPR